MSERPQDVLRLQPHMIPAVRATFRSAVDDVNNAIFGLTRGGFIPEPWLGDEVSTEVATHYARAAMEGPDSSYQALLAYRDELTRVHDTLQRMEDEYRRREGDNVAQWGHLA